jgi:hypothetical protein
MLITKSDWNPATSLIYVGSYSPRYDIQPVDDVIQSPISVTYVCCRGRKIFRKFVFERAEGSPKKTPFQRIVGKSDALCNHFGAERQAGDSIER